MGVRKMSGLVGGKMMGIGAQTNRGQTKVYNLKYVQLLKANMPLWCLLPTLPWDNSFSGEISLYCGWKCWQTGSGIFLTQHPATVQISPAPVFH